MPRALLTAAFAVVAVVLTIIGLSHHGWATSPQPRLAWYAICAAAALLAMPRLLPGVLVPAVAGQAVLLGAADVGAQHRAARR